MGFVFNIDILYTTDYEDEIRNVCSDAIESVEGKLNFVIALKMTNNQLDQVNNQEEFINERIDDISNIFECRVYKFSIETGENVDDIFYHLSKQHLRSIFKKKKKKHSLKHRKPHKKNRK